MARILITLLFLIAAVAIFFTLTKPYLNDINNLKADKQKYDEALVNSRELQTLRDKLLSKYNAILPEDIDRLNKMLPSDADSGDLLAMIENKARGRGLLLKSVNIKEELQSTDASATLGKPPPPYKTVSLSFSVTGPYASVLAFFADLEKSLRLIDMKAVGFSSSPTDNYQYEITAQTYYAVPSPASVAASAPTNGESTQEIVAMLKKLRSIVIDSEFFNSDVFKSLVDFVPALEIPQQYGRPNPFAPIK
jgi:Tfp pilus assembly protein PilO